MKFVFLLFLLLTYAYADTCEAIGDPHVRTFSNGWWDFQKEGDYLLLQNNDVTIQIRNRKWGQNAAVVTGVAIKFNGASSFAVTQPGLKAATINGKSESLKTNLGVIRKLSNNVEVLRTGKLELKLVSKETIITLKDNLQGSQRWPQEHYLNVIVQTRNSVSKTNWKGACIQKGSAIKSGSVFKNRFVHHKFGPRPHLCTKAKLAEARKKCTQLGFKTTAHFNVCVFDTCHGFSAVNTRRFFDQSKRRDFLRDRDLRLLVERAQRAVKFQNLMKKESKIIRKLRVKYESLVFQYRKVVARQSQKKQELNQLVRLEASYRNEIKRFQRQETSYKAQLNRYTFTRRTVEKKLVLLKQQESRVRQTLYKITKKIDSIKREIYRLTVQSRALYTRERNDQIQLRRIRQQIRDLKVKLNRYFSYESRFIKKLQAFRIQRNNFEKQIQEIVRRERQIKSLVRDLKQLNSEMFNIRYSKSKNLKRKSSCKKKVQKYKLKEQQLTYQLSRYRKKIQSLKNQLRNLYNAETRVSRDEKETKRRRMEVEKRISYLRTLVRKLKDERTRNNRNLQYILQVERNSVREIAKLRVAERMISTQIRQVLVQISNFQNQVKITKINENSVSIQLKNLNLQRMQLFSRIRKVEIVINRHNRLFEEYRRQYHNSLSR